MSSQNPIILCVDDEEENINLLESILIYNGYNFVGAQSGKDALLKVKNQAIDLIIMDILMPDMSGIEVCRQIKGDQNLREIPIIMVTALAYLEDRIRGIEAGADDYFTKPFHEAELIARIQVLLKVKRLNDERRQAVLQKDVALAALKKSNEQLENLNKVFVGRELKMIELKKRIAELEAAKYKA